MAINTQNIKVSCTCGNAFSLFTAYDKPLNVESCIACHPAYTGKRREVELDAFKKFAKKYGRHSGMLTSATRKSADDNAKAPTDQEKSK
mgnify:FL=1|jgi:large subunit ribosomal protein L31